MTLAAVADLKARLSSYLKQVKAGQEVIVTERGRPIARLVPITPVQEREARRDELIAEGLLLPGRGRVRRSLLTAPGDGGASVTGVVEALLRERAEGR